MNKYIAIVLLTIFTSCNILISYGGYKKGIEIAMAMLEEDETHLELLEVKKHIRTDDHFFDAFEVCEYQTEYLNEVLHKNYEDVYLSSVETPPDFVC